MDEKSLQREMDCMEALLREAKEKYNEIPSTLKEQIVLEHTPLIRYIVNRIAVRLPSHIDLDDLHNTGVIGLMDAIEKYDPDKNCKFKTYAEFRIKGAILDQLRSLDWVPRSVRQKSRRLEKAYGEVEQRLGRSASEDEVADSLGLQIDKFHDLLNQVRGISLVNLEEIRGTNTDGDRAGTFADIIEDVHSENPFASLKLNETKHVIADTIATLPEKERLVISLYYYEDLNMKEIGNILGITESRVCQIHTSTSLGCASLRSSSRPGAQTSVGASSSFSKRTSTTVVLSSPPRRLASSTRASQVSWSSSLAPTAAEISSSRMWLVRPSEHIVKMSPSRGESSARSGSTSRRTPRARVSTWRWGCSRAASALISLRRNSSPTREWSSVSSRIRPPRIR
jgi:RNA polymerase sigma factor for flagellar operon FliA